VETSFILTALLEACVELLDSGGWDLAFRLGLLEAGRGVVRVYYVAMMSVT